MTLRCFAAAPTTTPPLGWNDTTEGWTLYPFSSASTRAGPVPSAYATTVFDVPRSMPTIGSLRSYILSEGPDRGQDAIVPALQMGAERPHPAIRGAGELIDHAASVLGASGKLWPPHLRRGSQRLGVRLLLEVRAAPREPHGQRQEQVQDRHPGQREGAELAEVDRLVAQRHVALVGIALVPVARD